MAFELTEFLGVAESLADSGKSEAEYRTAVGRAFYAVWDLVKNLDPSLSGKTRINLAKDLIKSSDYQRSMLGTAFLRLENKRVAADYNNFRKVASYSFGQQDALDSINDVKEILGILASPTNDD